MGGILGGLFFFLIPRGKLVWKQKAKSQWNPIDLWISVCIGLGVALIINSLLPILTRANIAGIDFVNLSQVSPSIITGIITIIVQFFWLYKIRNLNNN